MYIYSIVYFKGGFIIFLSSGFVISLSESSHMKLARPPHNRGGDLEAKRQLLGTTIKLFKDWNLNVGLFHHLLAPGPQPHQVRQLGAPGYSVSPAKGVDLVGDPLAQARVQQVRQLGRQPLLGGGKQSSAMVRSSSSVRNSGLPAAMARRARWLVANSRAGQCRRAARPRWRYSPPQAWWGSCTRGWARQARAEEARNGGPCRCQGKRGQCRRRAQLRAQFRPSRWETWFPCGCARIWRWQGLYPSMPLPPRWTLPGPATKSRPVGSVARQHVHRVHPGRLGQVTFWTRGKRLCGLIIAFDHKVVHDDGIKILEAYIHFVDNCVPIWVGHNDTLVRHVWTRHVWFIWCSGSSSGSSKGRLHLLVLLLLSN